MAAALVLVLQLRFVMVERSNGRLEADASKLLKGLTGRGGGGNGGGGGHGVGGGGMGGEEGRRLREPVVSFGESDGAAATPAAESGLGLEPEVEAGAAHAALASLALADTRLPGAQAAHPATADAATAAAETVAAAADTAADADAAAAGAGAKGPGFRKNRKVIPPAESIKAFRLSEEAVAPLSVSSFHLPRAAEAWGYRLVGANHDLWQVALGAATVRGKTSTREDGKVVTRLSSYESKRKGPRRHDGKAFKAGEAGCPEKPM